ncbi:Fap1p KNAG_0H01990 [Huiozyma naganishii CBS 8797]|uniref:R3H domain-containing protein n=1 Tax=Huiozyma naganishii (strain ATCC MYA-139 / BCRC 22969 / CBS 8797 / KCTC 17520 / NBRC 10181 / NCYC 3082 / Yp74L-3) TaxID=1071383 RepID=J7RPI0_HUIN7|nr:hypothetical protein KNAG_0H01990 [Kazachstania naganishii CBS 8797]CCK71613.1 hypothetical protein KNAG_0H01990 [Kazachstania naganishii CBS 8797]
MIADDGKPDPKSLVLNFSSDDEDSATEANITYSEEEEEEIATSDTEEDQDLPYYERAVREIAKGDLYTCMICTVEMDYTCKMFACRKCYRVFDYDCVREWAIKSTDKTVDRIWKCPNCYLVNKKVPTKNRPTCWCGKVVNPEPNPLDPNSCGQTCDAKICIHGCSKICHLGPHPECLRTTSVKCRCGKATKEIPCFETKGRRGRNLFQCNEPCNSLLPCGIHRCQKICHSGLCGSCPENLTVKEGDDVSISCYCGQHTRNSIKCKDVNVTGRKSKNANGDEWIGVYACKDIRSVEYSCRQHSFFEECIAPPTVTGTKRCPFSPKYLKTCSCGKTPLQALGKARRRCIDPIPHCESRCDKLLKCGKHTCPFQCHDGPCMDPCIQIDKVKCACERNTFLVPCGFQGAPHCQLKCESLLSCRRHKCAERCCSGRPAAEERRKNSSRFQDVNDETLMEAEHVCLKACNLTLSCGQHQCQRKCHPGKCPPCLESDSNDLVCPCGKTIVPAPVRCGTKLPSCRHPCIKVVEGISECGHKPIPHACHPLDQPCPPCTATVFKPCKCGKNSRVRTICFQKDVSCGQTCGKPLPNCHHFCQKTCHLPGQCQATCKQVCNKPPVNCAHKCRKSCHGRLTCPDILCIALVKIRCPCGRKEVEVTCGATSTLSSSLFTERLECDEECEAYTRHRQLKEAFGITDKVANGSAMKEKEGTRLEGLASKATTFEELQFPFTESTISTYIRQNKWCGEIEETLNNFMDNEGKSSLHFKPMKPPQRLFIRELAKAYNLYSEAQDPEPKRSVFVKKNDDGSSAKPIFSLSEIAPLYQSFKLLEKERKMQDFLAKTTTHLINVKLNDDVATGAQHSGQNNAFLIKNISAGTTLQDLKNLFGKYMEKTLIRNPQYQELPEENSAIVYPEDYRTISANAVNDMENLVGHINFIVNDAFLADSAELCDASSKLPEEISENDISERLETPEVQEQN